MVCPFKCYLTYNKFTTQQFLRCIEADHAIANINESPLFLNNLWMSYLRQDTSCQRLYPVAEQQFQTLSCVHYTIFSVVKLDLYIHALLLDHILSRKKTTRTPRVHHVIY